MDWSDWVSVYGASGFVGSNYIKHNPNYFAVNRGNFEPYTDDVLYLISTTHNYNVFDDVHIDINTNLNHLMDVLEACRKKNIRGVFNFVSSWFVYGNTSLPATETSYCNPKGFYSITKRAAEQLLISYCETYGMKYRILRLGNVVGRGDKNVSAKKNALQYMTNLMIEGKPVELYEDGNFYRDVIHVYDCVRAINTVIREGEPNQIYNIGNGVPVHFGSLIYKIHDRLASNSTITSIPQKEFHKIVQVQSMYMDNSKIKALGYSPRMSLDHIVEDLIA